MVKSRENLWGAYAFLIGVVLAVVFGFFTDSPEKANSWFYALLVVIGIVVGFANSGDRSSGTFLMASLSLVIVGALGNEPLIFLSHSNLVVNSLRNILFSLMVLFIPATIVVALKTVFAQARI
ncbi:MAG: hypothetical protein IH845_04925 [Nanoarchaeota archaeon]|nr:hypothetical protein [Nanoarchaeota archaeon]